MNQRFGHSVLVVIHAPSRVSGFHSRMDTSLTTPTTRKQPSRKPKPQPLVRSVRALRAIVVGLTLLSLSGMTAYAGTHVQNSSAPLTAAAAVVDASTSTAVAVAQATTGTLTLSPSVQTTTAAAITTTHHS
jgi:hypothetical protein